MKWNMGLLLFCVMFVCVSCDGEAPATGAAAKMEVEVAPRSLVSAEENLGAFEWRATNVFQHFVEVLGVQSIVWRQIGVEGAGPSRVKIAFGVFRNEYFEERGFIQVSPKECMSLVRVVEALESAEFGDAWGEVKYQQLNANYGALRLRRMRLRGVELFVYLDGLGGEHWSRLDPGEFKRYLRFLVEKMREFDARATTIKW